MRTFRVARWGAAGTIVFAVGLLALAVAAGGSDTSEPSQPEAPTSWARGRPRLVVQIGHSDDTTSVAFSADGRQVLTGSKDTTAKLWDAENGGELRTFVGHSMDVLSVALSPDGRWVATGSLDHTVKLWDAATGKELRTFQGHFRGVTSVAFSADGRRVLTGSWDNTAKLWETATGKELRTLQGHPRGVTSVAFSPDGRQVLTGSEDNSAKLWDAETARELCTFAGHSGWVTSVAFSPDGRRVLTGSWDNTAKLWDTETGQELRTFADHLHDVNSVAFFPDGRQILTVSTDAAEIWDAETGRELRTFVHHWGWIGGATFSPDGRRLLTFGGGTAQIWDAETGQELRTFAGYSETVYSANFSGDGRRILIGAEGANDYTAKLWDTQTGQESRTFPVGSHDVTCVAFSPDSRLVLAGSLRGTASLWDAETGQELRSFRSHLAPLQKVVFSPDGRQVLTGGVDGTAKLWDVETGQELCIFAGVPRAISSDARWVLTVGVGPAKLWDAETGQELRTLGDDADVMPDAVFSPSGGRVLTGSADEFARLWQAETGAEVREFAGHREWVESVAFSADGHKVLTGSFDNTAKLWDVDTMQELRTFTGHSGMVTSVAFSPDDRWVLTGSADQTAKLWDVGTGRELCSLVSFTDGGWAVVAPDGRFDTDNLDHNLGLHWVMPDDPFHALPLEVFMRDYYEPGLLHRIIAGEQFSPVRSLMDLNRAQPAVKVTNVEPESADPGFVDVSIEIGKAEREFERDGGTCTMATGVYDLRLFRDGQIVGEWPTPQARSGASVETLDSWRQSSVVALDPATGKASVTFKGIKLPRQAGKDKVEFTAYAFSEDRVKSETARLEFDIPKGLTPLPGRAYVITVGVNASENPDYDLWFAAADAKAVGDTLVRKLSQIGEYREVVPVSLISDYEVKGTKRVPTETRATKANVKAVLDLLAGRKPDDGATVNQIPNADKLRPARPEDLVVISFSSHGYADGKGTFYFLPYDIGKSGGGDITPELLGHAISSAELTEWLRDVDAGQMAMIVDACHSAATVQGEGFKPGPMGSRGLGQLAYDKRMRILTASQAADVAREYAVLQHGLLTYALVHDGLEGGQADWKPKDGKITVTEWLGYGADRVPKLDQELKQGQWKESGEPGSKGLHAVARAASANVQHPVLFDFSRPTSDATIVH